ncbi:MAG: hypothetical protein HPY90_14550 [Syntrophothermus sp.]|uniref:hypothetical protein n=1 Tax=Syntrophothermus sp. TaxID=2736299 RepID=UPI0025806042|nr:hypothetical protein [Syntrophothermus sp.]NSW84452.1 hypothetical protein [Syntrophothermus sp.]
MVKKAEEATIGRISVEKVIKKTVEEAFESWRRLNEKKPDQINTAIKKAVQEAIEAGYKQAEKKPADTYKATERRLYALSDLEDKVEALEEYLRDIDIYGLPEHSVDLVRFQRSGSRLSYDEIVQAATQDLQARIAANKFAINEVKEALAPLTNDPYYLALSGRYFDDLSDNAIAEELHCEERTVRRHRGRLVRRVAIRLFGVEAV